MLVVLAEAAKELSDSSLAPMFPSSLAEPKPSGMLFICFGNGSLPAKCSLTCIYSCSATGTTTGSRGQRGKPRWGTVAQPLFLALYNWQ